MRYTLWILVILAFALAACQPTATVANTEAPPPVETQSPSPVVQATTPPAAVTEAQPPATSDPGAYPPPAKSGQGAYPAPGQEGTQITWDEAVALVMEGKIAQVMQTHSLTVILTHQDGQIFNTVEPEIDEIFRIVEQCGDLCKDISLATE